MVRGAQGAVGAGETFFQLRGEHLYCVVAGGAEEDCVGALLDRRFWNDGRRLESSRDGDGVMAKDFLEARSEAVVGKYVLDFLLGVVHGVRIEVAEDDNVGVRVGDGRDELER